MTKELYLDDSYIKECNAKIVAVTDQKYIVLDQTIFYPVGGGQPSDRGTIVTAEGTEYEVLVCKRYDDSILHEIVISKDDNSQIHPGYEIQCKIDWNHRYTLMRYHTAAHLLSEVIYKRTGARITGNQIDPSKARIDFNLELFDKELVESYISEANDIVVKDLTVNISSISKEEALKDEDLFSLANVMPKDVEQIRLIEIDGFDKKACGGTHVKKTSEIGTIKLMRSENKGKNNRRIYFSIEN